MRKEADRDLTASSESDRHPKTYMRLPVGLPFTLRREDPYHIRIMLAGQAISRKGQAYLLNFGDSATMHPSHLGAC